MINVKQVQNLLYALGFYTGAIDGIWGSKSKAALDAAENKYCKSSSFDFPDENAVSADVKMSDAEFWTTIKYFKREEFRCKCGGKYCDGFPAEPDRGLVRELDTLRARIGHPLIVNSGIRCKKHNAAVGGAAASQHLYGTAADISCEKVTPAKLQAMAVKLLPGTGGIGIYDWGIHFDVRKAKARWKG